MLNPSISQRENIDLLRSLTTLFAHFWAKLIFLLFCASHRRLPQRAQINKKKNQFCPKLSEQSCQRDLI